MPMKLVTIKRFTYRGDDREEWSNGYFLDGPNPASDAEWKLLADDVIASEKQCYSGSCKVVKVYGYNSGALVASWSYDYLGQGTTVPGTHNNTDGGSGMAGDQAVTIRWRVGLSAKGKPVYVHKFIHGSFVNGDVPTPSTKAKLQAHATTMQNGSLLNGRKITDPQGTVGTLGVPGAYVTTRTLKRRGKRPLVLTP